MGWGRLLRHWERIANEILMYLRRIRNQKTEISLYDPVGTDREGNEVTLMDILGSRDATVQESVELAEEKRLLLCHLHVLSAKECYVLRFRYGLNNSPRLTQKQVAAKLGISRSYVSRIEKKALEKLKKSFV